MKLSILVPMYNVEKYIGNCLDSLLHQDIELKDYEIIVMDDGSTDGGADIVEDFMKRFNNIKFYKQKNAGLYATRNKLLKLAKGTYIFNIDSDDYIVHNSLGTLLKHAFENDVEVLGFDSTDTTELNLHETTSETTFTNLSITNGIDFWGKYAISPRLTVWWYFIKLDFIQENEMVFETGSPFNDTPFTFKLFLIAKKVLHIPMDVHRYVQIPTSIMNNNDEKHLNKMIDYHIELAKKLNNRSNQLHKKKDSKLQHMTNSMKYWRDVNVYFMFKKFLKTKTSRKRINHILDELEDVGAYPMSSFKGDMSFSKNHKIITYFFNNKTLFLSLLQPIRLGVRLKLIKLPVK